MENKTCVRSSHIGSCVDCELTYVKAAARCHDARADPCAASGKRHSGYCGSATVLAGKVETPLRTGQAWSSFARFHPENGACGTFLRPDNP